MLFNYRYWTKTTKVQFKKKYLQAADCKQNPNLQ